MGRQTNQFSWTFERPFRFRSNASLREVMRALASLQKETYLITTSRDEISIQPLKDGYTFQYRFHRRSRRTDYVSVYADGHLWQDSPGDVTVEGTARINHCSLYASLIPCVLILIVLASHEVIVFLPVILAVVGVLQGFTYYSDRNQAIRRISEAVQDTMIVSDHLQMSKNKLTVPSDKPKNPSLSQDETVRADSVWNDAISEHEEHEQ